MVQWFVVCGCVITTTESVNVCRHFTNVTTFVRLTDPSASEQCLVQSHAADIYSTGIFGPYADTFFTDTAAPTEDGIELAKPLQELSRTAVPAHIKILAGANMDEGTEFMNLCPAIACNVSQAVLQEWSEVFYGDELGAKVPSLYEDIERPAPKCRDYDPHGPTPTSDYWLAAMRSAGRGYEHHNTLAYTCTHTHMHMHTCTCTCTHAVYANRFSRSVYVLSSNICTVLSPPPFSPFSAALMVCFSEVALL